MYSHLFSLLEVLAWAVFGAVMLYKGRKAKNKKQSRSGVILLIIGVIRSGFAYNDFVNFSKDREMTFQEKHLQSENLDQEKKNETSNNIPLEKDSLLTFDGTVDILVPKWFTIKEHFEDDLNSLILTKGVDTGTFSVVIAKIRNKEQLSFNGLYKKMSDEIVKSPLNYETTNNNVLPCDGLCTILNYKTFPNGKLDSEGMLIFKKVGDPFYMISFNSKKISIDKTKDYTDTIYKSLNIRELF